MPLLLAIDRSQSKGSWALLKDETVIIDGFFQEALPRSPTWFPSILEGLTKENLKPSDIQAYLVGTGPGSFSGIRAVLAAIQGLALPTKTPVLGVTSVAAMAYAHHKQTSADKVAIVGDARRGKLWLARYDFSNATTEAIAKAPVLITKEELSEHIEKGSHLLTPEYAKLSALLNSLADCKLIQGDGQVTAKDLAMLYIAYPDAALRDPLPVYLHPAVS